jgi:hypothetical protein
LDFEQQFMNKKWLTGILILFIFFGVFVFLIVHLNKEKVQETESKIPEKPEFHPENLDWEEATSNAPWSERDSFAVLVFKDKIFLMGGLNGNGYLVKPGLVKYEDAPHFNDVWVSEDGKNWQILNENCPWGKRRSMALVDFQGKIWLFGGWGPKIGLKNDVWYSEDGKEWVLATSSASWEPREGHQVVVFKNKLWLVGGVDYFKRKTFNDVWFSEDGINWFLTTSSSPWESRWDHALAVFKDKIWLTGGMNLKGKIFKDVWASEDGINWVLVNENPPWKERQGHSLIFYLDRLWLLGRLNDEESGGENDVWYSENGTDWQKTKKDPPWLGREDFGAVVFKDKIWIMGGMDRNWHWQNDVWYSK